MIDIMISNYQREVSAIKSNILDEKNTKEDMVRLESRIRDREVFIEDLKRLKELKNKS